MRDFTPEELATVQRMAGEGKSRAETRRKIKIAPHNFAANIKALGIVFAASTAVPGPAKRVLTAAELKALLAMAAAGHTKTEALERVPMGYDNFTRLCAEHGIVFAKRQNPPPVNKRCELSPEQEAEFKRLAPKVTRPYLAAKFGISISTVARFFKDFGIVKQRAADNAPGSSPKKGRNPRKDIGTWRPRVATTTLEAAVDKLRRKYPVFAETTLKHARSEPRAYTLDTVFVVGSKRMTGAEILEAVA